MIGKGTDSRIESLDRDKIITFAQIGSGIDRIVEPVFLMAANGSATDIFPIDPKPIGLIRGQM